VTREVIADGLVPEIPGAVQPETVFLGYPSRVLAFLSVLQVIISAALVTLILMHSGREAGFGGMGFTPTSQGGTHIVERNLTRLTVIVAALFFVNTIILYRQLA
jgi:preprotein translocase subunit SecG